MTGKTHKIVGMACTLPLLPYTGFIGIFGLVGSTLPDIDLRLGIKHRTVTHNLLVCFSLSFLIYYFCKPIGIIFCFNYLLHLFLDSCTIMGVPFLYPFNKKYYGLRFCRCGGQVDNNLYLFTLLGMISFCVYWITKI